MKTWRGRVEGPPANPTSLGEVWVGDTRPTGVSFMEMSRVEGPPANPTSLGEVWVGDTRPVALRDSDELRRLRVMEARLLAWATQLEATRDRPGDVGQFIAAELRRRMTGD